MTSPDGITWTARLSGGTSDSWNAVTYGNGIFVAVGDAGDRVMTSGKTFTTALATNNIYQGGMSVLGGTFNIGTTTPTTSPLYGLNVLNIASTSGSSLLTISNNGNVGIGSSTPARTLSVTGDASISGILTVAGLSTLTDLLATNATTTNLAITGKLYDGGGSAGTNGYILQTTGTGVQWVSTTTLGFGGGSSADGMSNWLTQNGALTPSTTLGIRINASSTIGDGTGAGGLTIDGNSTTTRNAYVGNNLYVEGDAYINGRTLWNDQDSSPFLSASEMQFFGSGNTLLGVGALQNIWNNASYGYNTAVGVQSFGGLVVGNNNTSVGSFAFSNMATGTGNVAFGYSAGSSQTEGDNNIVIGNSIDLASTTGSNQLNIGNLLYGTGLGSDGKLGIGTTSPRSTLTIQGSGTTDPFTIASSSGSSMLTVTSAGHLLVGTSTASTLLGNIFQGTTTLLATSASAPTALRAIGNIDNTASSLITPKTASTTATGDNPNFVYVSGRYAYVANYGTDSVSIIDISNPASPVTVSTPTTGDGSVSVYVSGRYAYVANYNANTMSIIDISNPAVPVTVSALGTGLTPRSVYVSGRYAYVANYGGASMSIIDISNPASPVTVSTPATGVSPYSVYVSGRYAYVANSGGASMSIIDISNPASPVTVSTPATGAGPRSVYVSGRYAYVANNSSSTMSIIDISNPSVPVTVSTTTTGAPASVYVSGRYAYVANQGGVHTMSIIDISNPASPVTVSTPATGANPASVYVSGRYAYVANVGGDSLSIIDIGGLETTSAIAHSLEAGNLSVRNDISAGGNLNILGALTVGNGGFNVKGDSSVFGSFAVGTSTKSLFSVNSALNRVNIGTSTGDASLFIQGTSTKNLLTIVSSTGASLFTILANGNVGIGSSTPVAKLSVTGTGGSSNVFAFASSTGSTLLTLGADGRMVFGNNASADIFINGGKTTANPQSNSNNVAIGNGAFTYYTSGSAINNTAIGYRAFYGSSTVPMTGDNNVAIGYQAGYSTTWGQGNFFVGEETGYSNIYGSDNIAIGSKWSGIGPTFGSNTTGSGNIALGQNALSSNTTGDYNIALGAAALNFNTTGNNNIAQGYQSQFQNGTGSYNNALGNQSLFSNTKGSNNIALGNTSGYNLGGSATSSNNTFLGAYAGQNQTQGDNNIFIGYDATVASTTGSNQLSIGNLIYGLNTATGANVATGTVGIGTTSPRSTLTIQGSGTTNPFAIASSTGDNLFSISSSGILNIRSGTSTQASTTNIFVNGGSATTTVQRNIALGFDSLTNITTGANDNIAFGYQALLGSSTAKMTGYNNFAAGRQALYSNTTGSFNNALGLSALYSNTTGKYNNAFGADSTTAGGSLSNNTTGSYNNALGGSTLAQNTTGSNNNAFGNGALINNTTGSNNNALGSHAGGNLGYIATSSGNIFLGAFAGQNQAQGDNNIFIGYDSQVASTTGSNQLSIGNLIYGLNTATGANVATGTVGIGTTSPRSTLTIQGSGTTNPFAIASSSGSSMLTVLANGNVGIGTTSPSAKLSIHAKDGETNRYLLNIASSTASATSSLFSVLNNGYVHLGSTGFNDLGGGELAILKSSDNTSGSLTVGGGIKVGASGLNSNSSNLGVSIGSLAKSDTGLSQAVLMSFGAYTQTSTPSEGFSATFINPTYNQVSGTASNTDLRILRNETAIGSGAQYLINAQTGGALNAWATSTKFSVDRTGLGYFAGKLGIGTTTPVSLLTMGTTSVTTSGVAGLKQYFSFMNPTASSIQYGDETYIVNAPTATSTLVGKMIRIEDTSTLGNTVRGLEAQAFRGTNTKGENTGLSGYGRTFGVRGTTLGDAGSVYVPAGVFAESQGTTQGNALRAYSGTITSEDLVSLFHDGSAFTGTGLSMNFGNSGGSFAATSSAKFIDFQVGGTSKFTITSAGTTTIGDGTTANMAGLQIGFGGLCVDNDGSCTASTTGRITSVSSASGNSDLAEMYFSSDALESGEIVSLVGGLSVGRAQGADSDETIIGVVSTKPGLIMGFDDTSLSAGETAYPIALKGRVPIKLSTENGPIMKGDRIALSSIPGVGMKAEDGDTVVGIALEDYSGEYAYSPAYLNQFGSDLVKAKMQARSQETDPRTQDGCSYGGGNAQGEAPCVKDKVAPIKPITVSVDTKTSAMNALKTQSAEIRETEGGQEVTIGQAIMFVHLHDFIAEGSRDVLAELSATSSVQNGNGTETLWDRVKALAQNFVDGVLRVTGIKTEELCVGNVCVDEATFLKMVEQAGGVQSSGGTSTEGGATGGGTDTTDNSGTVTPPPEEPTPTIEEPTSTTESPVEEPPAQTPPEELVPPEPEPTPEPPII